MIVQRILLQHKQLWLYALFFRCAHSSILADRSIREEVSAAKELLHPYLDILNERCVVFASSSRKWREVLVDDIGIRAVMFPATFDELQKPQNFTSFGEFATLTATRKVLQVWNMIKECTPPIDVIIGTHTMLCVDEVLYGKPNNESEAKEILKRVNNNVTTAWSGIAVKIQDKPVSTYTETANIHFGNLKKSFVERIIPKYADDSAGSFGIQVMGDNVIKVDGEYCILFGLPLKRLAKILVKFAKTFK